jgi:hypothetical protein
VTSRRRVSDVEAGESEVEIDAVAHGGHVAAGELLDALDPVAQRVDVHVELLGGALPRAAGFQKRGECADQVRAVQSVVVRL